VKRPWVEELLWLMKFYWGCTRKLFRSTGQPSSGSHPDKTLAPESNPEHSTRYWRRSGMSTPLRCADWIRAGDLAALLLAAYAAYLVWSGEGIRRAVIRLRQAP
jgi:hypothetical protein